MVVVAQLVRALVCGTRGRGFESHLPPLKPMQTHRLFCCSKAASPSLSNVVMWTLRAQSQYLSLPCNSCNSSLRHQDLFFAASATLPCNSRNSQWAASCRRGISVQSYCPLCNKIVLWWALPLFRRQSPRVYCPLRNAERYLIPIREYSRHELQDDAA